MTLSRLLFRVAARTTDLEVLASGNPRRIVRHYARKSLYRTFGRSLRRVLR